MRSVAGMHILHVSFQIIASNGCMAGDGIAGSYAIFVCVCETATLFSTATAPIYIPSNSAGGLPFSTPSATLAIWTFLNDGLSDPFEVVSH